MKKLIFSVAVVGFVALGFTSCGKAKCIECDGDYEGRFCEEDWDQSQMGMTWKQWSDIVASSPDCKKVK